MTQAVACFSLFLWSVMNWQHLSASDRCLYILTHMLFLRWVNVIHHNHVHVEMFHSTLANEAFHHMCAIIDSLCPTGFRIKHVKNHHSYHHAPEDWNSPFIFAGARFPDRPVHPLYYILTFELMATCALFLEAAKRGPGCLGRVLLEYTVPVVFLPLLYSLGIVEQLTPVILFGFVSHRLSFFVLALANIIHHTGRNGRDRNDLANTDLSLNGTLFDFNVGYHGTSHPPILQAPQPCAPFSRMHPRWQEQGVC